MSLALALEGVSHMDGSRQGTLVIGVPDKLATHAGMLHYKLIPWPHLTSMPNARSHT